MIVLHQKSADYKSAVTRVSIFHVEIKLSVRQKIILVYVTVPLVNKATP